MTDVRSTNGASAQLQARLDDPNTVAALNRLLDRVESLDKMMGLAEELIQQGPGLAAVVADSVDEFYVEAARSGTDLELVLQNALQVATRLQNPRLIQLITQLLDQTESLELLVSLIEQGPGVTAMLADSLDEMMRTATSTGLDPEALLQNGFQIALRLQNPRLINALTKLLDQTESLEMLASLAEQGPGVVAMVADSVDEMVRVSAASGIDFDILMNKGLAALIKFISVVDSQEFDALLDSGILEPHTVGVVGQTGRALAQSYALDQTQPHKVGPMGLFKSLNDPDVQRALGFLTAFAKQFGRQLAPS
ncbi:MAG: DUF1641 domain-containing protein [Anaerolineales bacterium]|nr:DUF1641 domain-containing protein [Anaerolineales bacterium]